MADPAGDRFLIHASPEPRSPVVVAVPHAGRCYPRELVEATVCSAERLAVLEDPWVDLLVEPAIADGAAAVIATRARAWIDLNRDPRELDPAMVAGDAGPLVASAKVRAGLGLIPRRTQGGGEIYRAPLPAAAIRQRIAEDHLPYHAALADALAAARARFGTAVLLDCHSMPPLPPSNGRPGATVVVGDRHGRTAAPRFGDIAADIAEPLGHRVAFNVPYAGGYTLTRHGKPAGGVHAIQLELSRALYLDRGLREPGPGLAATRALVRRIAAALADAVQGAPERIAAE